MAEEIDNSVTMATVPPKANPLSAPATVHAPITATQTGLKPGLKLPPKPGATVTGLKPGLKLPPKPGATLGGLKPGVRLPTRPMIRKPGMPGAVPAVKPPVAAAPAAPAATPAATPAGVAPVATPTVAKPEQAKPLEALKAVTQNLKSITSPIPQQAILRKTGIIADAEMTEAQKQAAKSKTARISLSDAMGVAPVKSDALPMKTIRIKRPTDIPGAAKPAAPAAPTAPAAAAPAATTAPAAEAPTASGAAPTTSFTQRKTLKITRPGASGAVRPTGKFGVKKPAAPAAAAPAATDGVADIADIPDLPPVTGAPVAPMPRTDLVPDVSKGVATMGLIVQIAACAAMAFLGYLLYQSFELPLYCGGCGGF